MRGWERRDEKKRVIAPQKMYLEVDQHLLPVYPRIYQAYLLRVSVNPHNWSRNAAWSASTSCDAVGLGDDYACTSMCCTEDQIAYQPTERAYSGPICQ